MDRSDFSFLVARLERQAIRSPGGYALKVKALAVLGYLSLFLFAAAIVGCVWLSISVFLTGELPVKIGGVLAALAVFGLVALWTLVRALWIVDISEPAGLHITRDQAPRLFDTIDELRRKMGGVKVHSVSVSNQLSASILQKPLWGVFGNYRNHLTIGLPLVAALSVDEFKAVLAHEMGHITGSHGKFDAWIFRQRATWQAVASKFRESSNFFELIVFACYAWYAPYFHAYTFVLARTQEYDADRAAAEVTNPHTVGAALLKLELVARFLGEVFWKRLFDQVSRVPAPPYMPYAAMPRAIRIAEKEWARRDWLQQGMRGASHDDDTHPSLSERLGALAVEAVMPKYQPEQSALRLLEPIAPVLVKRFDDRWRADVLSEWKSRHAAYQAQVEPTRQAS
jgi:hypothetical protein